MIGIGVDILSIARMTETINRSEETFLNRVFTKKELEECKRTADPVAYYAKTFAAKEAVFKTFCIKERPALEWHDIEIQRGEAGEPIVILSGYLKQIFIARNCEKILLSLSWETDTVVAYAALI